MRVVVLFILLLNFWLIFGQNCNVAQRVRDIKSHKTPIRGVNLGSWFNLESWMVPKLWTSNNCNATIVRGQWQFERCVGSTNIQSVLQTHWSTFINETDFQKMSAAGINAVRVPIGWWSIYDTFGGASNASLLYPVSPNNYTVGSLSFIDSMFDWAEKYSIAILLCMHAAPGAQNTADHSSPIINGQQNWDKNATYQNATLESIEHYAKRYANKSALLGFALLNEPSTSIPPLQSYYLRAYPLIRQYVTNDPIIVINPLISPFQYGTEDIWVNFMNPAANYTNVWMDLHFYACFGGPWNLNDSDSVVAFAQINGTANIQRYNAVNPKPMAVLEWSTCGVPDRNNYTTRFTQAQISAYGNAKAGWTFWAWLPATKGNVWSFQTALREGWVMPSQLDQPCFNTTIKITSESLDSSSASQGGASVVPISSTGRSTSSVGRLKFWWENERLF